MRITIFGKVSIALLICTPVFITGVYNCYNNDHSDQKASGTKDDVLNLGNITFFNMEQAYMAGQKDALAGDIKIVETDEYGEGCWVWSESPWDSKRVPTYKSNCEVEQ